MFDGSCYYLYTNIKTLNDSLSFCKAKQANLVSINSLEENNLVWSLMKGVPASVAWIGLVRAGIPPSLSWTDGSSFGYHEWYGREPDDSGQCVYMRIRDGKWVDQDCTSSLAFICKS
jgi:hypothetical protein